MSKNDHRVQVLLFVLPWFKKCNLLSSEYIQTFTILWKLFHPGPISWEVFNCLNKFENYTCYSPVTPGWRPHGDCTACKKNSERRGARSEISQSAEGSPWHLHWTPWGLLGRHATARTLCMHKVRAVARRSHGDLNERRANAVGSQRQRSNSAVRSPRAPRGRRAHAAGTHMIAARTTPYATIIRECNEGIKNWQISEFQFSKPYFQPFCSVKYRNQANTTYFRGCVPEMSVTSYFVTYCIYIPGKPGFCFHYYCAVYDEFKYSDTFWLVDLIRLFVHNTISLS